MFKFQEGTRREHSPRGILKRSTFKVFPQILVPCFPKKSPLPPRPEPRAKPIDTSRGAEIRGRAEVDPALHAHVHGNRWSVHPLHLPVDSFVSGIPGAAAGIASEARQPRACTRLTPCRACPAAADGDPAVLVAKAARDERMCNGACAPCGGGVD